MAQDDGRQDEGRGGRKRRRGGRRKPRRDGQDQDRSREDSRDAGRGDRSGRSRPDRDRGRAPQPLAPFEPAPFHKRKVVRRVFLGVVCVAVVLAAYALRAVFNPLLIGLLVAYILNPIVNWLEARRIRRVLAVILIYAVVLVPCVMGLVVLGTLVYEDASRLPGVLLREEAWLDANKNGMWDPAEPFVKDDDKRGVLDEATGKHYLDLNENGKYDPAESVTTDANGNGRYDLGLLDWLFLVLWEGDRFEDVDGNGRYDAPEVLTKDYNGNGQFDPGDEFEDANGNGQFDEGEKLTVDHNGNGRFDPGDEFDDANKNGKFDVGDKLRADFNGNGRYDAGLLRKFAMLLPGDAGVEGAGAESEAMRTALKKIVSKHGKGLAQKAMEKAVQILEQVNNVALFLVNAVLVGVYAFLFLLEMNNIGEVIFKYIPGPARDTVEDILHKVHKSVSSFFRGRLMVCAIMGALAALGMTIFKVRFAILLGLLIGVGDLVPFLGVIIGLFPALTLSWVDHHSTGLLIGATIWFVGIQWLEGMVIIPYVLGKEVEMHPVTLIVALLIGAQVFGLFGVLIAIPLASILKILGTELVLPELERLSRERDWA